MNYIILIETSFDMLNRTWRCEIYDHIERGFIEIQEFVMRLQTQICLKIQKICYKFSMSIRIQKFRILSANETSQGHEITDEQNRRFLKCKKHIIRNFTDQDASLLYD